VDERLMATLATVLLGHALSIRRYLPFVNGREASATIALGSGSSVDDVLQHTRLAHRAVRKATLIASPAGMTAPRQQQQVDASVQSDSERRRNRFRRGRCVVDGEAQYVSTTPPDVRRHTRQRAMRNRPRCCGG